MKAAIWTRVSTDEQETVNQLEALRTFARSRGLNIIAEYQVKESAYNGKHRAELDKVLQAAHRGEFEVLCIWALDRLTREGVEATAGIVRRFRERGVRVLSLQESWLDTAGEVGELLMSVFGWMARQESLRRSERIKAGLARRRRAGHPVGRQPGAKDTRPRRRSGYVARWERVRKAGKAA